MNNGSIQVQLWAVLNKYEVFIVADSRNNFEVDFVEVSTAKYRYRLHPYLNANNEYRLNFFERILIGGQRERTFTSWTREDIDLDYEPILKELSSREISVRIRNAAENILTSLQERIDIFSQQFIQGASE